MEKILQLSKHTPSIRQFRIMFPCPFVCILHFIIRAYHTTWPRLWGAHALNRTYRTQLLRWFSLHTEALSQRAAHRGQKTRVGGCLLWYTMCVCIAMVVVVMQETCFLAWLHEEMAAFVIDEPVDHVLFAFGAAAAGAGEGVGGRGVDGEGEEIGRLGEVGYHTTVGDEVD
jgi:hypothetical protein